MNKRKKVLILTAMSGGKSFRGSKGETDLEGGCERLNSLQSELHFHATAVNELVIQVRDGIVSVHDMYGDYDLADFDFVHMRNTLLARDHFQAVALYLQYHGIAYADIEDATGTLYGKTSQAVRFALGGLPVPDMLAVWNTEAYHQLLRQTMSLPFILKDNLGIKGARNYLIREWYQADEVLAEHSTSGFVAQPFIPNEGDYRVLQLGARRIIMHRRAGKDSHLNNARQGGSVTAMSEDDCPEDVVRLAAHAIGLYGRTVNGADVLVTSKTGQCYILEVNDTPAILSGSSQEEKELAFIEYVQERLYKDT